MSSESALSVPSSTSLMRFGKHAKRTYSYVIANHSDYCRWILSNCGPDKSQALLTFADFLRANFQVAPPGTPPKSAAITAQPPTPSTVLRAPSSSALAQSHSSYQPAPDSLLSSITFAILDTETTGLGFRDRVVEVAVQRISSDGRQLAPIFSCLVNPGAAVSMSPAAAQVTGISNHMIHADGVPSFARVYPSLTEQLQACVIVAHNAAFDAKMIMQSCDGQLVPPIQPWLCTLLLSRRLLPLSQHKLSNICDYYGISINSAHRASGDVEALAKVLPQLLACAGRLHGIRTWGELQSFIQKPAKKCAPAISGVVNAVSGGNCGGGSNAGASALSRSDMMSPPKPYDASAPCGAHEWDSRTRKWNGNMHGPRRSDGAPDMRKQENFQ